MTRWRETTLGEVILLQRGFDLTRESSPPGPYPVISSSGTGYTTAVSKVEGPGVITGRKGVLGKVHFAPGAYWPHDTTLWVKDFKGSDPRFIYYLLHTLPLASLDAGASNPTLNRNHAHLLPVRVPDPATQRRVSAILGVIDDLIENSRRRIELLERIAQAVYQEWFVHFRYPGHYGAALVDSPLGPIPEAWSIRPLSDVADARRGLSWGRESETEDPGGTQIVTIPNIGDRLHFRGCTRLAEVSLRDLDRFSLRAGDILLIGSNGNPARVGQAVRVAADTGALFASFLMRVRPDPTKTWPLLLFYQLTDPKGVVASMRASAVGSTGLRNVRISSLRESQIVVPDLSTLRQFDDAVRPLQETSRVLDEQAGQLEAMRDLLLPRLVAGQIDVSKLDLGHLMDSVT